MRAGVTLLGAAALIAIAGACDTRPPAPAPVPVPERTVEAIRRDGNHLVGQPSPYLEQHAHNPVDWYPWGPEALDRAKREHRLIFVSVGYATCHWCHVMEKETFEDDDTARLLNARFIAIKIDREERPDLDALFVDAVTRLGESAGWPLDLDPHARPRARLRRHLLPARRDGRAPRPLRCVARDRPALPRGRSRARPPRQRAARPDQRRSRSEGARAARSERT